MSKYLIDQEVLDQLADGLMDKKPLPLSSAEENKKIKEELMSSIDKEVGLAIFGKLSNEQLKNFNHLLDNENEAPETFRKFFEDSGVDVQKTISDTFSSFEKQFLGGHNE